MSEASTTFEAGMTRLEEIVRHLEAGDVPLEDTIRLFKEGIEIRERCGALLQSAESEIKVLMARAGDGRETPPENGTHEEMISPVDRDDLPFE